MVLKKVFYLHSIKRNNLIGNGHIAYFRNSLMGHTSYRSWKDHHCPQFQILFILDIVIVKLFVIL